MTMMTMTINIGPNCSPHNRNEDGDADDDGGDNNEEMIVMIR